MERPMLILFSLLVAIITLSGLYPLMRRKLTISKVVLHPSPLPKNTQELAGLLDSRTKSVDRQSSPVLHHCRKIVLQSVDTLKTIEDQEKFPPSIQWVYENVPLIERYIHNTCEELHHTPPLPTIRLSGYRRPRVALIARYLLDHCNYSLSAEGLSGPLQDILKNQYLTMSELWQLPVYLQAELIYTMLHSFLISYHDLICTMQISDLLTRPNSFTVIRRLLTQDGNINATLAAHMLTLIEQGTASQYSADFFEFLNKKGTTPDEITQAAFKATADHGDMARTFRCLHQLACLDWNEVFENSCPVDRLLAEDPTGLYSTFKPAIKQEYRSRLEFLSKKWRVSELQLAKCITGIAAQSPDTHIGYYLFDREGQKRIAALVEKQDRSLSYLSRGLIYIGIIYLIRLVYFILNLWLLGDVPILLFILVTGIPGLMISKHYADRFLSRITRRHKILRLSLRDGIPEDGRTLVVTTAMVSTVEDIESLFQKAERTLLRCPQENVYSGLLLDLPPANQLWRPQDDALVAAIKSQLESYQSRYGDKICVYLRPRTFHSSENQFMGYERKRGALLMLCQQLATGSSEGFMMYGTMTDIHYVITLDTDTEVTIGAVKNLIGAMLHPLNKPVVKNKRVEAGYGLLQPRIIMSPTSVLATAFSRILGGNGGLEPYTNAVFDPYQDWLGHSIFTGKAILDARIFYELLRDQFKDETILSHDLIEGSFMRTGYISDVSFMDDFPHTAGEFFQRMHRWTRGDWQLLPYLKCNIINRKGIKVPNPMYLASRLQTLVNLLYSLYPLMLVLILATSAWYHSYWMFIFSILPWLTGFSKEMLSILADNRIFTVRYKRDLLYRLVMNVILLPVSAGVNLDAIIRTLYRLLISHRKLLEWTTAAQAKQSSINHWQDAFRSYPISYCLSLGLLAISIGSEDWFSMFMSIIFLSCPYFLYLLSRPSGETHSIVRVGDEPMLADIMERIYGYFRDFICEQYHYLPPDNFQEYPLNIVAPRTSPTNIGMAMVCLLCSCRMGWVTYAHTLETLMHMTDSIESLEKWHGHLYNWYDVSNCQALHPFYVSSVDSGNFACYILLTCQMIRSLDSHYGETDESRLLMERLENLLKEMDFAWLYDEQRHLFYIGFNVDSQEMSNSHYDLLASEARQAGLYAISQGQISPDHWFHLARNVVAWPSGVTLKSWGGSMFEYFMAAIIFPHPKGTLLGDSLRCHVDRQIAYADAHGLPWGVSESGYFAFDVNMNYQYKSFGIPDMGIKSGLQDEIIISPYSSMLAINMRPEAVKSNLEQLISLGMLGKYGLYEAIDYTYGRIDDEHPYSIVKSYMAHHQAMAFLSLYNYFNDDELISLMGQLPSMAAIRILLDEQPVSCGQAYNKITDKSSYKETLAIAQRKRLYQRTFTGDQGQYPPHVHVLSNGKYSLHITATGSGQSKFDGLSINRWRDDAVSQGHGIFMFIKDKVSGHVYSATAFPPTSIPEEYTVSFSVEKAVYTRKEGQLTFETSICIDDSYPLEYRSLVIRNEGTAPRELEVTAYWELVLNGQLDDLSHATFQNLFVETWWQPEQELLWASRRPRSEQQQRLYMCCSLDGPKGSELYYVRTSRLKAVGRHHKLSDADFLQHSDNIIDASLPIDPCAALGRRVTIPAGESVTLRLTIGCQHDAEALSKQLSEARERGTMEATPGLSVNREYALLRQLGISNRQLRFFYDLLPYLIYDSLYTPLRTLSLHTIEGNQKTLWSLGISGDYPIVTVLLEDSNHLDRLNHILSCHTYLRTRGVIFDVVILHTRPSDYQRVLRDSILQMIHNSQDGSWLDCKGGIHVIESIDLPASVIGLLKGISRAWFDVSEPLTPQLDTKTEIASFRQGCRKEPFTELPQSQDILLNNGFGGFDSTNLDYIITGHQPPPLPWCNVLSNYHFGAIMDERGRGYTWYQNSRENKLTALSGDTLGQDMGECLYLRNEETGAWWDLTGSTARYGWGYCQYEGIHDNVRHIARCFVPHNASVKIWTINLKNLSDHDINVSLTAYCRWILGPNVGDIPTVLCDSDAKAGLVTAQNHYREQFQETVAYLCIPGCDVQVSCGRAAFIGVGRDLSDPIAMENKDLDSSIESPGGAGILRGFVPLFSYSSLQLTVLIGAEDSHEEVLRTISRFSDRDNVESAYSQTMDFWEQRQTKIQIKTPDPYLNILFNKWVLYQCYSSRIMAHAGYYQAGGAIGFRDQLQDCLALIYTDPGYVREHILLCATHQFEDGDVQHWWHPPYRGVRTKISDDLLFLPFVVCQYIAVTGDYDILKESASYLNNVDIGEGQEDWYGEATPSDLRESLLLHLIRAIRHACRFGEHGLPLIGTGDWNDAMSSIGDEDRGESVWLAFFLYEVLREMLRLLRRLNIDGYNEEFTKLAENLGQALEQHGWDGEWYRRAYSDSGTPIGSQQNAECQIDCICQAWAAISGAGSPDRADQALDSALSKLWCQPGQLLRLLYPPFRDSQEYPGYIQGYLPGVRENGGQYTHGALWTVWGLTQLGRGNDATALLSRILPDRHSRDEENARIYMVEPYVVCADIYAIEPHIGRGGWTWYTGSASWMHRIVLEEILGLRLREGRLYIHPCIDSEWSGFEAQYHHGSTCYNIHVRNAKHREKGMPQIMMDGRGLHDDFIPLEDDGLIHEVQVILL